MERIIASLAGTTEGTRWGNRTWLVNGRAYAWVRPFSKADVKRFGADPVPAGLILAVRVENVELRDVIVASGRVGHFTIPHLARYPAMLLELALVSEQHLCEALEDAYDACTS